MVPQLFSPGYREERVSKGRFLRTLLFNFTTSCASSSPSASALHPHRSVSTKVWGLVNCSSSDQYDFRGLFCFFRVFQSPASKAIRMLLVDVYCAWEIGNGNGLCTLLNRTEARRFVVPYFLAPFLFCFFCPSSTPYSVIIFSKLQEIGYTAETPCILHREDNLPLCTSFYPHKLSMNKPTLSCV